MKLVSDARVKALLSRPPHGGRGLKLLRVQKLLLHTQSPPTRGAWIEIYRGCNFYTQEIVAPHTGGVD